MEHVDRYQAYTDDLAVPVVGRSLGTVCRNIESAVGSIDSWCLRYGHSVNPNKTTTLLFTNERKLNGLSFPEKEEHPSTFRRKYLGLILDNKLLRDKHVEIKMPRYGDLGLR